MNSTATSQFRFDLLRVRPFRSLLRWSWFPVALHAVALGAMEGRCPLDAVRLNTTNAAPDVGVSFR